jgi:ubiquinone/menaquinone biosynthesis C-methylase UbiE
VGAERDGAGETSAAIDLSAARRMLDIGGGPGVYAIEFARRNPRLQVVILDNQETLDVARRNVERAGLEQRVTFAAGDALADEPADGFDFILLSNLLHSFAAGDNAALVGRCGGWLRPGGRLCVKDFILEGDRTAPAAAALFAVNMLVNTEEGNCYTAEEIEGWLAAAGFGDLNLIELTPPNRMIMGTKA